MSRKAISRMGLDACAQQFYQRGGDRLKDLTSEVAWLRFVENATTKIAEYVRRGEHTETLKSLGDAFGWLCSIVENFRQPGRWEHFQFNSTLSGMVWHKYPGKCYACIHRYSEKDVRNTRYLPCLCLSTPDLSAKEKRICEEMLEIARQNKRRPRTVDEWADMIREIYEGPHKHQTLEAICLHFLEEVGEVAQCLRKLADTPVGKITKKDLQELEDEIGDVFSWTFGLINKLNQTLGKSGEYYALRLKRKVPPLPASEVIAGALSRL